MNIYQRLYLIYCKSHSKLMTLQQRQNETKNEIFKSSFQFNYFTVCSLKLAGRWNLEIKQETDDSEDCLLYMFIYIATFQADEQH